MPKKRPTLRSLIADTWLFYRKQPVLNAIVLWLWIFPSLVTDYVPALLGQYTDFEKTGLMTTLVGVLQAAEIVAGVWGIAAVLLIARRMVQNRAGRPRTSFTASAGDALPLVWPLLATSLLRSCGIVYWSLLFLLPALVLCLTIPSLSHTLPEISQALASGNGNQLAHALARPELIALTPLLLGAVIYAIRTSFYSIALVADDERYRAAFRRSRTLVRGHFWRVTGALLAFFCAFLLPAFLLSALSDLALQTSSLEFIPNVISYAAGAYGALFSALALTLFYGRLRDERTAKVEEVQVS